MPRICQVGSHLDHGDEDKNRIFGNLCWKVPWSLPYVSKHFQMLLIKFCLLSFMLVRAMTFAAQQLLNWYTKNRVGVFVSVTEGVAQNHLILIYFRWGKHPKRDKEVNITRNSEHQEKSQFRKCQSTLQSLSLNQWCSLLFSFEYHGQDDCSLRHWPRFWSGDSPLFSDRLTQPSPGVGLRTANVLFEEPRKDLVPALHASAVIQTSAEVRVEWTIVLILSNFCWVNFRTDY